MAARVCARYNTAMEPSRSRVADGLECSGVCVQTLVLLRCIAVVDQFITIAVVGLYPRFPLPQAALLSAIGAAALLNIGLARLHPRTARLWAAARRCCT